MDDRGDGLAEEVDPLLGTMIGRYRIEQRIGMGGMGSVYELLQPAIHKRMALKLLHKEYASRKEIVQRFFDEARAVNLIGHPSIVDITDFGHLADGRPFIIMEFLQGENLDDYLLREGALAESEVLEILRQLCSALSAAHAKNIVHRDLKPENIFLVRHPDRPLQVKVLDFGIAKLRDKSDEGEAMKTQTGVVLGTPTYMSPEQAEGRTHDADHRTDIYSLGVMLYQMLSGAPPFQGKTFAELIVKHISEPPPSLLQTRSGLDPAWARVVSKALGKKPEDRYQSVQAMLTDASVATAPGSAGGGAQQHSGSSKRHGRDLVALLIALVLVAGGTAAWMALHKGGEARDRLAAGPALVSAPSSHSSSLSEAAGPAPITGAVHPTPGNAEQFLDAGIEPAKALMPVLDARGSIPAADAATQPRATKKPFEAPRREPKNRGKGLLQVSADPWAQVYLDGARIGQTPLRKAIPAGKHKIRLRNESSGETKVHVFQLKKGETKTIREHW